MNAVTLTRRDMLSQGGALVVGFTLAPMGGRALAQGTPKAPAVPPSPNAYIRIAPDDSVTILSKHIEFGQGPYTGIATLIAEELDADWTQMRAAAAPADARFYGNSSFGGMQGTGGSTAMASSYMVMREAAARARAMLVLAAAQAWKVDPAAITVEKGVIGHAASGRTARFGAFAEAAAKLPVPPKPKLKDAKDFRLIGRDVKLTKPDTVAKTNGSALYTIDIRTPEMLTVVVARSPRFGGTLDGFDAAAATAVPGVVAVKAVPTGVAVYANGMWPALKGRAAIVARWNDAKAEMRDTDEMVAAYMEAATTAAVLPKKAVGDVDAALAAAGGKAVTQDFVFPFLAHAPMEPLDGYLEWDGKTATARFGSQIPTLDQGAMAKTLGIPPEQVKIEVLLAGGSFGRRATPSAHLAVELAEVAKAIGPGKPVKLVWTREDDIMGGHYRPLVVHRMAGAIENGRITAWKSHIATQSFMAGGPFAGSMKDGADPTMTEGASEIFYKADAFRCAVAPMANPVSTLWWRSVGHTHTAYAVECFVDRLLQADGRDPIEGRIALMSDPRAIACLRAVAKLAGWQGPMAADGRARGVAIVESFKTMVAEIAEVSIGADGVPRVHKVWAAADVGQAINPDVIRAQLEGGIGYALGHALFAEVPLAKGVPAVRNFDQYRSLRINEMPEVEVVIMPSSAPPTGIGEPGVPPLAPAVANAIARLGRERPARLPMVRGA
ncbi:MAG: molybdopterin-dependent oxidoreductase [Sphingomonas fennica]